MKIDLQEEPFETRLIFAFSNWVTFFSFSAIEASWTSSLLYNSLWVPYTLPLVKEISSTEGSQMLPS